MYQATLRVISIERLLLYCLIISMATYAVPFMRVGGEESSVPIGALFLPLSCFLLILRFVHARRLNLHKALLLSLFLLYLSIPLSLFSSVSLEWERIFKLSVFMLLPILFTGVINDYKSLRTAILLLIGIGVVLGLYGFYGYFTGNVGEESQKFWWHSYSRYWGIHYLPSTRNSDVYYVAAPLLLALAAVFFAGVKSRLLKVLFISAALMFCEAILLSLSRGAWIATALTMMALVLLIFKRRGISVLRSPRLWLLAITGLMFLIVGMKVLEHFGMYDYFVGRALSIVSEQSAGGYLQETVSNEQRKQLIKSTLEVGIAYPLGVGPGNLGYFLGAYDLFGMHAENSYMQVLAENGILGFIGYMVFLFYPMINLSRRIIAGSQDWLYVGIFLMSLFLCSSYMFNVGIDSFYIWIVHSIIWCSISIKSNDMKKSPN